MIASFNISQLFGRISARSRRVSALGVVGVAALVFSMGAIRPDQMLVEHVVFEGNSRASDTALRHLADLRNGTTIWGADLQGVERGVQRHPWVQYSEARREWPNTVVVEVAEYRPYATLLSDRLMYVNENGYAFHQAKSDDLSYPVITGAGATVGKLHPHLAPSIAREAVALLIQLEDRNLMRRQDISEVSFNKDLGWTVFVEDGVRIRFALENLPRQFARLHDILSDGVHPTDSVLVDLGPEKVAIVTPLKRNPQ